MLKAHFLNKQQKEFELLETIFSQITQVIHIKIIYQLLGYLLLGRISNAAFVTCVSCVFLFTTIMFLSKDMHTLIVILKLDLRSKYWF